MARSLTSSLTALNAPAKQAQMTRISSSDEAASLVAGSAVLPTAVAWGDGCAVACAAAVTGAGADAGAGAVAVDVAVAVAGADAVAGAPLAGADATACGDGWAVAWRLAWP